MFGFFLNFEHCTFVYDTVFRDCFVRNIIFIFYPSSYFFKWPNQLLVIVRKLVVGGRTQLLIALNPQVPHLIPPSHLITPTHKVISSSCYLCDISHSLICYNLSVFGGGYAPCDLPVSVYVDAQMMDMHVFLVDLTCSMQLFMLLTLSACVCLFMNILIYIKFEHIFLAASCSLIHFYV